MIENTMFKVATLTDGMSGREIAKLGVSWQVIRVSSITKLCRAGIYISQILYID